MLDFFKETQTFNSSKAHDTENRMPFEIENIMVIPNGKGNSSQQMGKHGREELRKCVYVWRKI